MVIFLGDFTLWYNIHLFCTILGALNGEETATHSEA